MSYVTYNIQVLMSYVTLRHDSAGAAGTVSVSVTLNVKIRPEFTLVSPSNVSVQNGEIFCNSFTCNYKYFLNW